MKISNFRGDLTYTSAREKHWKACVVIGELKSADTSFRSSNLAQVVYQNIPTLHLNVDACFVIEELKSANASFRLPEHVQVLYENILYASPERGSVLCDWRIEITQRIV